MDQAGRTGKILAALRAGRGLSQNDLAAQARVPAPVISRLEKGNRDDVRLSTAARLAHPLCVPVDVLAGGMPDLLAHDFADDSAFFIYAIGGTTALQTFAGTLEAANYNAIFQPSIEDVAWAEGWLRGIDDADNLRARVRRLEQRISDLERGDAK